MNKTRLPSTNPDCKAILEAGFDSLGLVPSCHAKTGLLTYVSELNRWNRRFGFVNASDEAELAEHVLDSLSGARLLETLTSTGPILDLGSGSGLPGIPLAFMLPKHSFYLCERKEKEAAFLENIILLCGIQNARVYRSIDSLPGPALAAVFRAVKAVFRLLPLLLPALSKKGVIMAYKGTLAKTIEETTKLQEYFRCISVISMRSPSKEKERHALLLKKTDLTYKKTSKPAKKMLR